MSFLDSRVPYAIAHQGGTDVAPGNTEAAFDHAVSLGYRYIETDVQATTDGVLAVFHDDLLAPLTGAPGSVADHTWEELQAFRVGETHPIPRFDAIVGQFPDIRFNIDPKSDGAVGPLIKLIEAQNLQDRVCIGSFADARLGRIREALPGVCMSPGPKGVARTMLAALIGSSRPSRWQALQIPTGRYGIPLAHPWLIGRYQRQGLQVHIWTINDEATMRSLLDDGVDALITDEVGLLKDVLVDRGQWSPS